MDTERQLALLSLECQKAFQVLVNTLDTVGDEHQSSNIVIEDELGRFRLWANNIGAMRTGKASLDYRLREVDFLFHNVKLLLQGLKQNLNEGSQPVGCTRFLTLY